MAYTPHQNGVAERKNRTILNMLRCMLNGKKVPEKFWPEAAAWCVHILNRSPTTALDRMTPEEAWSGQKPSVSSFKVFGCIAHVHVPQEKRKKLDKRSVKCVMFGLSEESKAYRLYDPAGNKIIVSKDVIFEEDAEWNWENKNSKKTLDCCKDDDIDNGEDQVNAEATQDRTPDQVENEVGTSIHPEGRTSTSLAEAVHDETENQAENARRTRREPEWMKDYVTGECISEDDEEVGNLVMFISVMDPSTFEEAVSHEKWRKAMDVEIEAINKNETWELCSLPQGVKAIGVKWLYKTKLNENGEVDKCKARLVVKGYAQKFGIDYTEVFAPVVRWDTIRPL